MALTTYEKLIIRIHEAPAHNEDPAPFIEALKHLPKPAHIVAFEAAQNRARAKARKREIKYIMQFGTFEEKLELMEQAFAELDRLLKGTN